MLVLFISLFDFLVQNYFEILTKCAQMLQSRFDELVNKFLVEQGAPVVCSHSVILVSLVIVGVRIVQESIIQLSCSLCSVLIVSKSS